ncbi:MAG: hypothetical protein O2910_02795 [Proteobacteria bacterium]|jgi:hypothetical protein|nr:hypothetical protein [Pseudomonadota bacterium]
MSNEPEKLAPEIRVYMDAARALGKQASVYTFLKTGDDLTETADRLKRLEDAGVDVAMASVAYDDADGFSRGVDTVQKIISA